MSLSRRLHRLRQQPGPGFQPRAEEQHDTAPQPSRLRAVAAQQGASSRERQRPTTTSDPENAFRQLKGEAAKQLYDRIGSRLNDPSLTEEQLHGIVRGELNRVVAESSIPLSAEERQRLNDSVRDDLLGYGPLEPLLDDDTVTEVMVNGPDAIYIERDGHLEPTDARFTSEEDLRLIVERTVSRLGRGVDEWTAMVEAGLRAGTRVDATIPPLALKVSPLTVPR